MKIGIFGGTFDPPHIGHKKYACEFIDRLSLDKLLVIPTCIPPHKDFDGVSGYDRLEMTKRLFSDSKKVEVSDIELCRKGKSYTCDTVKDLSQNYPNDELIFLVGSDMLLSFHKWREPKTILRFVKICAVSRDKNITEKILSDYVEKYFPNEKDRFIICEFSPIEINSTSIRNEVKLNGKSDYISTKVMDYINEKGLYR